VTAHHFITHPVHHQMQFVITELNSTLITYSNELLHSYWSCS